jgi:hypothetical protein
MQLSVRLCVSAGTEAFYFMDTPYPVIDRSDPCIGLLHTLCSCNNSVACEYCDLLDAHPSHILMLVAIYQGVDKYNRVVPTHAVVTPLKPSLSSHTDLLQAMTRMQRWCDEAVHRMRANPVPKDLSCFSQPTEMYARDYIYGIF